jgi:GNAT superfamily N-acetyltransferase
MIVEAATQEDARAIGMVHVLAWHETYRGIVPDQVLASLNPRERAAMWERVITTQGGVFVLREGARVVGFAGCGPNRDASFTYAGMFNALYLLRHTQRHGHGRRLMAAMARHLLATGRPDAVVWSAEANHAACRFYERLGGQPAGRATELHEGWDMACVAYGWDDLSGITEASA